MFLQIFDQRQYATDGLSCSDDIEASYEAILKAGTIPIIVDAGANVGLSALYFHDLYPDAKILSIAPEEQNFHELERRADPLTIPMKAGLTNFDSTQLPPTEDSPAHPISPYGITKLAAEHYALMHRRLGLPVTIARPSNIYGPGQRARRGQGLVAAAR